MKIILAHKFLHMMGGTEVYFKNLAELLHKHGHSTIPFAIKDERNPKNDFQQYFPESLDFRGTTLTYKIRNFSRIIARTLYSPEARHKMAALIEHQQPDIAHLQCIENHISPSIVDALHQHNIPMVQSVNTYKHVCTSYRLYRTDIHEVCTRCVGGHHYHALLNRCVKGSAFGSALGMLEMYLHQSLMRIYHQIDRFIVPNSFMANKMYEGGYAREKVITLRNPFHVESIKPCYSNRDYFLYFGRVEPEKGVVNLVKAMQFLKKSRLVVVGDGSDMNNCLKAVKEYNVENIDFVGPKWGDQLTPYLQNCTAVVVPSLWHEPSPYVIYQALAQGKPVIGSRVGGIPDLITEDTGRLFNPLDIEDLAQKMESIFIKPEQSIEMGKAARYWAEKELSPQSYYKEIMGIYTDLQNRR